MKAQMTKTEIPDIQVGDVWNVNGSPFRILALPEKRKGPWSTDRTRSLVCHQVRATSLDPAAAEPPGGHWLDETCFPYMELVTRYEGGADA